MRCYRLCIWRGSPVWDGPFHMRRQCLSECVVCPQHRGSCTGYSSAVGERTPLSELRGGQERASTGNEAEWWAAARLGHLPREGGGERS